MSAFSTLTVKNCAKCGSRKCQLDAGLVYDNMDVVALAHAPVAPLTSPHNTLCLWKLLCIAYAQHKHNSSLENDSLREDYPTLHNGNRVVSQVCHSLDEPQATNVLVIRLCTSQSHGRERPHTLDIDITQTHHRQCNTALLLIIEITCSQHLARISATSGN
jgi:hypothetical protein